MKKCSILIFCAFFLTSMHAFTLRFSDAHTFKIAVFSDLHYGKHETTNTQTQEMQEKIIDYYKPDLVVLNGNVVSGDEWDFQNSNFFQISFHQAAYPMLKAGVPWMYVRGNLDLTGNIRNAEDAVEYDNHLSANLSLTELAPSSVAGGTFYNRPVLSSHHTNKIALNVWAFDSGQQQECTKSNEAEEHPLADEVEHGCISRTQLESYKKTS